VFAVTQELLVGLAVGPAANRALDLLARGRRKLALKLVEIDGPAERIHLARDHARAARPQ
jgi:hypothetical protein